MAEQVRLLIKDWEYCLEAGYSEELFKLTELLIGLGAYMEDNVWKINLSGFVL